MYMYVMFFCLVDYESPIASPIFLCVLHTCVRYYIYLKTMQWQCSVTMSEGYSLGLKVSDL